MSRLGEPEEWVVWNGLMGILLMARVGSVEEHADGRRGFLAPPFDSVGPFSLDELETSGRIEFGACLVMSRLRWQQDQVDLRFEAHARRRAYLGLPPFDADDGAARDVLDLPRDGVLEASEIRAAFRRLAKTAHPDAGGSDELYRRITEARDALLEVFGGIV